MYTYMYVYIHIYIYIYVHIHVCIHTYIYRPLQLITFTSTQMLKLIHNMIGLVCTISSLSQVSFAKETYNYKQPTSRRHPILIHLLIVQTFKNSSLVMQSVVICCYSVIFFYYRDYWKYRLTMGWLWLVKSIKLCVSWAKEPYKRGNILQKRPII